MACDKHSHYHKAFDKGCQRAKHWRRNMHVQSVWCWMENNKPLIECYNDGQMSTCYKMREYIDHWAMENEEWRRMEDLKLKSFFFASSCS